MTAEEARATAQKVVDKRRAVAEKDLIDKGAPLLRSVLDTIETASKDGQLWIRISHIETLEQTENGVAINQHDIQDTPVFDWLLGALYERGFHVRRLPANLAIAAKVREGDPPLDMQFVLLIQWDGGEPLSA